MPYPETAERREYYRIQDKIALQISDKDPQASTENILFNLLNELFLLESESQPLLRSISESNRTIVNYLKLTNKRIDLLAQAVAQNLLQDFPAPQEVTLSEGGISFCSDKSYHTGDCIQLQMVLLPQSFGLQLAAKVVNSSALTKDGFKTSATFYNLTEAQRQVLARHIMQKQAQERRQALESNQ